MIVKQIVLDKNDMGEYTMATFHYWDKKPPSLFFFNPPIEMPYLLDKLFEKSKENARKEKSKGKHK